MDEVVMALGALIEQASLWPGTNRTLTDVATLLVPDEVEFVVGQVTDTSRHLRRRIQVLRA